MKGGAGEGSYLQAAGDVSQQLSQLRQDLIELARQNGASATGAWGCCWNGAGPRRITSACIGFTAKSTRPFGG